ncbi:ATP-binding protein [Actinoplanes sp. N902-109]|uniref:ATP-binding protein n=1 Tax=Actinoplanes sp. (strain N902-109) TaxID=649831 RepID=UPI0018DAFD34|nr:ATP-binding protein [Actinoplanes sp. N902-109]
MPRPPAPMSTLHAWSVTVGTDLATIRDGVTRLVAAQPADVDAAPTAQAIGLVATELAGNALRHGKPPVLVRLLGDDDCYVLDVSDHGIHDMPRPMTDRQAFGVGGRGLMICMAIADQVSWYTTATTKHIWASFPRPRSRRREP